MPGIEITDNFSEGSNGFPLQFHTPDLGTISVVAGASNAQITNNRAHGHNSNEFICSYAGAGGAGLTEQNYDITVPMRAINGAAGYHAVIPRFKDSSNYILVFFGANTVIYSKVVAGGYTEISSTAYSYSNGVDYEATIEVREMELTVKIDGAVVGALSGLTMDAAVTGSNKVGLYFTAATASNGLHFDSFTVETLEEEEPEPEPSETTGRNWLPPYRYNTAGLGIQRTAGYGPTKGANKALGAVFAAAAPEEPPPVSEFDVEPSGGDDTAAIVAALAERFSEDDTEIVLGTGTFKYSNVIFSLPEGTTNFTIRGQGIGQTILQDISAGGVSKPFFIGLQGQINNNFSLIGDYDQTLIGETIAEGATTFDIAGVQPSGFLSDLEVNKWYALYDAFEHQSGYDDGETGSSSLSHYELVYVTGFAAGTVTIQTGVGREFHVDHEPTLAHVKDDVCSGITIKDLTIDGNNKTGALNLISFGNTINSTVQDVEVKNFTSNGLIFTDCRSCTALRVTEQPKAGQGYGILGQRSRFITVTDPIMVGGGHSGVMAHTGTMDMTVTGGTRTGGAGGYYDMHGAGEIRYTVEDSEGEVVCGNYRHSNGGYGHRFTNVVGTQEFYVGPQTTDVIFTGCEGGTLKFGSSHWQHGESGVADGITFLQCAFGSDQVNKGIIFGDVNMGTYGCEVGGTDGILFDHCILANTNLSYGNIIAWRGGAETDGNFAIGRYRFDTCVFALKSNSLTMEVSANASTFKLEMVDCFHEFRAGGTLAVYSNIYGNWTNGTFIMTDNIMRSTSSGTLTEIVGTYPAGSTISGTVKENPYTFVTPFPL